MPAITMPAMIWTLSALAVWCRTNGPRSRKTRYMTSAQTKPEGAAGQDRRSQRATPWAAMPVVRSSVGDIGFGRGHGGAGGGVGGGGGCWAYCGCAYCRAGRTAAAGGLRLGVRRLGAGGCAGGAALGAGRRGRPRRGRHGVGGRGHDLGHLDVRGLRGSSRVARRLVGSGRGVAHRYSSIGGSAPIKHPPGAAEPGSGVGRGRAQGRVRADPERHAARRSVPAPDLAPWSSSTGSAPPARCRREADVRGHRVHGRRRARLLGQRPRAAGAGGCRAPGRPARRRRGSSRWSRAVARAAAGCTSTRAVVADDDGAGRVARPRGRGRARLAQPGAVTKSMSSSTRPSSSGSRSA